MADIDDRWYWRDKSGKWHRRARYGQGSRWLVRWRDPEGAQRKKSFERKPDAENYATRVENDMLSGFYISPDAGKVTMKEWGEQWLQAQAHMKPSTWARYESVIRNHIIPKWGSCHLSSVRHAEIQTWVSTSAKSMAATSVRKVHRVLSLMLSWAVKDERIARNPAENVKLPKPAPKEHRYLDHAEVEILAKRCGSYGLVVRLLAYTGLRWGELAALTVKRVDVTRRRIVVAESVTEVNGTLHWSTPKTHEQRSVPVPRFIATELEQRLRARSSDELAFTAPNGGVLRVRNFRRDVFDPAVRDLGLKGLHPHELRHTAASLSIASGADVKIVQEMLGHKAATMTLDLYGHLFPDRLDDLAERLERAACAPNVPQSRSSKRGAGRRRRPSTGEVAEDAA